MECQNMIIIFMNMKFATNIEDAKLGVTHSYSICEPIIAHLNANAQLR